MGNVFLYVNANHYFFSYTVEIHNGGEKTVQLVGRHWIITDAHGKVEEVQGAGVVGQQPTLEPGESFKYSSFCPLPTPTGTMEGSYLMAAGKLEGYLHKHPLVMEKDNVRSVMSKRM